MLNHREFRGRRNLYLIFSLIMLLLISFCLKSKKFDPLRSKIDIHRSQSRNPERVYIQTANENTAAVIPQFPDRSDARSDKPQETFYSYRMTDEEFDLLHEVAAKYDSAKGDSIKLTTNNSDLLNWINLTRNTSSDLVMDLALDIILTPDPSIQNYAFNFVRDSNLFTNDDINRFAGLVFNGKSWVALEASLKRMPATDFVHLNIILVNEPEKQDPRF
jgi:hypothetical protein